MPEQFVLFPPALAGASQRYEAASLLAAATRYSLPDRFPTGQLERDLDLRLAGLPAVGVSEAAAWFTVAGVAFQSLADQVAVCASGDTETLHLALQRGNDNRSLHLLGVADASKLVEVDESGATRALWSKPESCLLLRLGYHSEQPYAYYAVSLPGDSHRAARLTWQSVLASGVLAAIAILPPKPALDLAGVQDALHIMEQAMNAASSAHGRILDLLGLGQAAAGQGDS